MAKTKSKPATGARHPEAAYLRRFKQITTALGENFIQAGWQENYRQEDADRLLRYLERRANGSGPSGKLDRELQEFLYLHGQCLDYFYTGNPRGMFSRAAAHSAVGSVIREGRKGVQDRWTGVEREAKERDAQRVEEAREYLAARKSTKPAA